MAGWGSNTFGYLKWGEFGNAYVNVTNPNDTYWGRDAYGNFYWGGGGNLDASIGEPTVTAEVNSGFGGRTWNFGSWGDLKNVNLIPTSFSLDINQGQAESFVRKGWGATSYGNGEWGDLSDTTALPTGIEFTATLGDETTAGEINEGWGRLTWGEKVWNGFGTLIAQGQELNSNTGSVTIDNEINSGWGGSVWGFTGWGAFGTAFIQDGIEMSANLGTITVDNEINIGWGSDTWGTETWGISGLIVDLTGIGLTATLDDLTISADGQTDVLTGEEMTATQGDAEGFASFVADVTGQPMTMTLQYQEAIVDPTGQELTANDGTADLDANTIVEISATSASTWNGSYAWGSGAYGNEQVTTLAMETNEGTVDPAPDANITGIEMTATLDDVVTQGNANTGVITPIEWGEETWGQSTWGNGDYFDATGYAQAATINLGTAVLDANTIAEVSGQEMTIQENDVDEVTGNANVLVLGNALTMAEGSLKTLIWNEVNTGTAPVVPPGWQEVDTAA